MKDLNERSPERSTRSLIEEIQKDLMMMGLIGKKRSEKVTEEQNYFKQRGEMK